MKKLILTDYDGVIVDSLPIIAETYNSLFKKYKLNLQFTDEEFARLYIGNFHESLAKIVPAEILPKILEEKGEQFRLRNKEFKVFSDVKKIFSELSKDKDNKIIIISSNTTLAIKENLKINKLNFITDVIGGDIEKSKVKKIISEKKKHPELDAYYIGDTAGDIKEAKKAGVRSVAVCWGFHNKKMLEKEKPDFIVESPEELLKIFI